MARFSFGNAAMHFAQADGPGGFLWKYVISYILATALLVGASYFLFQPVFGVLWSVIQQAAQGVSEAQVEAIVTREMTRLLGRIIIGYIAMLLLGALFWAVFEAAIQRRYVREEGFSIGLGGDEFRLLVVGLLWVVFMIVFYILTGLVSALLVGIFLSSTDEPSMLVLIFPVVYLLSGLFWAYFAVRLSPASAMTIRDRKIHFFGAWGATRKRFLPLFLAYVVLALVLSVIFMIVYFIGGAAVFGTVFAMVGDLNSLEDNPEEIFLLLLDGTLIYPFLGFYFVMLILQGILFYVWAGPAALAAKTDPRGGGVAQAPDVFV